MLREDVWCGTILELVGEILYVETPELRPERKEEPEAEITEERTCSAER